MFCSSRQHGRNRRQQTPGSLACSRAPGEVQCGVTGKKLTEGGKIAGCQHILTGLKIADIVILMRENTNKQFIGHLSQ